MLRYAQFRVSIATADGKHAVQALDRTLFEIDKLTGESRLHFLALTLSTALMELVVPLTPRRWFKMLRRLGTLPNMRHVLRQRLSRAGLDDELFRSPSGDEVMFLNRATDLNGIDELCELIDLLDREPDLVRDRYLLAASNLLRSVGHIVSSAWLSEVRSDGFDGNVAAAKLARVRETASRWKYTDMAVELACAEAAMRDEYADDKPGALAVLRVAQSAYPQDYRINRQRQKVYYRNGDHALALAEFESFSDSFSAMNPVDRAWAMREAGRSASEVGDLDKTRVFFEQAWVSARECGDHMRPMQVGLSADCAILDFQANKIDSALAHMLRALEEAESIDPQLGLRDHYCLLILTTAILWMRGGAADWPIERQAMVIGMCSNPDPLPEMKDRRLPQRLLPWYELAELETQVSDQQFVLTTLRQRTTKDGLLTMEITLAGSLMRAAVRLLNVDRFLEGLPTYPRAVAMIAETLPMRRTVDLFSMPTGQLKPVKMPEWGDKSIREATASAVLIFGLTAVCSNRRDAFEDLRDRLLGMVGVGASLAPLFETMEAPPDRRDDLIDLLAGILGQMLQKDFMFDARDAFGATVHLIQLLNGHVLGETAAGPIFEYFAQVWRDLVSNRAFLVRSPAANGPSILAALSMEGTNRAKLAHLVLASAAAVRSQLSNELREMIRKMTEHKRTPLEELRRETLQPAGP
jgi:tetratricopeptide (TPR) repeat protein